MGNKFCKKRVDNTDGTSGSKTPKTLNKIINKLNLKPKWKSDSNLEDKQINSAPAISTIQVDTKPLSRSTDWIDCSLEAAPAEPRKDSTQSKKSIFNDDTTPTPPPRKCTLVRKSLLDTVKDAFKTSTPNHNNNDDDAEIEEQIMVKKTINYNCPCGGPHSRGQHEKIMKKIEKTEQKNDPQKRSRSIVVTSSNNSLPSYNDFRLSLPIRPIDDDVHNSAYSLPDENAKKMSRRSLSNDIDAYLTRAKSIGSLIPSVLQRLSTNKAPLAQIESDDSLNSLDDTNMDDWGAGLNMIEHYEPRESSLPRPSKRTEAEMISDLEGMIVDEIIEEPPIPPARKSETMLKKIHKDVRSSNCTPPSTPEETNYAHTNQAYTEYYSDNHQNDHSPLMKILHEFKNEEQTITNDTHSNRNVMRSNISPVHTYIGQNAAVDASPSKPKGHINDFLAAERNDELYKERIAT